MKDGRVLCMRKMTPEDAKSVLEYGKIVGSETQYLLIDETGFGDDVQKETEWIESVNRTPNSLSLMGFVDGELAGMCGLLAESKPKLAHNAGIGITVKQKFWGLGVGTAMLKAAIDFAKATCSIKIIHLEVFAENERAIRLYKYLGFEEVGRRKQRFCVNGKYHDEILMDLHLEDY